MAGMFSTAFHEAVYVPLYNGLVFLVDTVPFHDVGLAVILLTIAARILLLPLSRQAIRTQAAMREVAPEIEKLKEQYKEKQEEQARAIFALYREKKIRPFSSFFLILLQLPILFGLYWVFLRGGLPNIDTSALYGFMSVPENVNMHFLGLVDMAERSTVLAVFAGVTQLIHARLSMGPRTSTPSSTPPSFSSDLAKSMDLQMRYVLPIMIAVIAYTISAAVALYWVTSNTFMILQEYFSGRHNGKSKA
jgi:YidC/Oxa1 family membrane protein insertase